MYKHHSEYALHVLLAVKKNRVEEADEVILLCKSTEKHYKEIEKEVLNNHSYDNLVIFALPISHMSKKYATWLQSELKG